MLYVCIVIELVYKKIFIKKELDNNPTLYVK